MTASPIAFIGSSISGGEILIILVVALLLFGAKNLPGMARNLGKTLEQFRRASREVTDEIMRADLENDREKSARPGKTILSADVREEADAPSAEEPDAPAPRPAPQSVSRNDHPA